MKIKNYKQLATLLLVYILTIQSNLFSQAPTIQWQKSLGGTSVDYANFLQQTTDGGYIVAGSSYSNDGDVSGHHGSSQNEDCWIAKVDNSGTIQWQKSLGGIFSDYAYSIQQTTDGGYIVAGSSYSNDGDVSGHHGGASNTDFWIIKLNISGTIQWQKSLGGTLNDGASSILQTSDGGFIVAGSSHSNDGDIIGNHGNLDYWIVKLNASGTIQWQKSLGGTDDEGASSIQQTTDGGYIVAGYSNSNDGDVTGFHGLLDYWIVKLDVSGNILWQKSLGGTDSENATSIQQTTDGGYIVAGSSKSTDGDVSGHHGYANNDYWIVKLDALGNIQWQKSLGGTYGEDAFSIQQTTDAGYIVAGSSYSNDGDVNGHHGSGYTDCWIVKLDVLGNILWQKSLGGTFKDYANSIRQAADGGFVVAGYTQSNDGDVTGNHGLADYWVVKLSPTTTGIVSTEKNNDVILYPNPANTLLTIKTSEKIEVVYIYNLLGALAQTENTTTFSIETLPSGMYMLQIKTTKGFETARFVKE